MMLHRMVAMLSFVLMALAPAVAADTGLKNWFNDPFIQVRNALPACPLPLGPMMTEDDARKESHWRVERGTSCWLAGQCSKPNSYAYDHDISKAVAARFARMPAFARSSLWLTFQRRFVWVEGCTDDPAVTASALEAFVRAEPDVERVIVDLMQLNGGKSVLPAPYPVASGR